MQAARGASLISATDGSTPTETPGPADGADPGGASPPRRRRRLVLLALVAAALYAVDVATKIVAVARLEPGSYVEVVGPWLTLTLVRNPGAAFSTGTGFTEVLSVISIVATLVVLWVARRVGSVGWAVGLGLLLAGVLGNLTDRLLRQPGPFEGHVIDFLRLPNWPVFNVADMCINVAAAIILVQAFRGVRVDGTRERDATAEPDETAGETAPETAGETAPETAGETADGVARDGRP